MSCRRSRSTSRHAWRRDSSGDCLSTFAYAHRHTAMFCHRRTEGKHRRKRPTTPERELTIDFHILLLKASNTLLTMSSDKKESVRIATTRSKELYRLIRPFAGAGSSSSSDEEHSFTHAVGVQVDS